VRTGGAVLSAVRWAADSDYHITVLSDLCADSDVKVHIACLESILPIQATVAPVSSFGDIIKST